MRSNHLTKDLSIMITLLTRQELLALNPIFAAYIIEIQDANYNPLRDYNKEKPGMAYFGEEEGSRYISQEECDVNNEQAYAVFLQKKDTYDTISLKGKHVGEAVYNFQHAPLEQYLDLLANGFVQLCTELQWDSVLFLLDYSTPWLYQNNDFEPVQKALNYLKSIGVDNKFNGGFKASGDDLKTLVKNLFWLVRCNAALPLCSFAGANSSFAAEICKYGNMHFHFYAEKDKAAIEAIAPKILMQLIEDGRCHSNFTEASFTGRQIIVD